MDWGGPCAECLSCFCQETENSSIVPPDNFCRRSEDTRDASENSRPKINAQCQSRQVISNIHVTLYQHVSIVAMAYFQQKCPEDYEAEAVFGQRLLSSTKSHPIP
ncbi:uncharacterized protein LOC135196049 [Macrobrachium nipponense]|uniref:uncharacterized protein LOC135196049 n=1 Tax=Macrobrachium nipponense TaxID=159736 RepID=UPI0030C8395E